MLAQPGAVRPTRVRFFRAQMQTIIGRALGDLGLAALPSRRCLSLLAWLEERVERWVVVVLVLVLVEVVVRWSWSCPAAPRRAAYPSPPRRSGHCACILICFFVPVCPAAGGAACLPCLPVCLPCLPACHPPGPPPSPPPSFTPPPPPCRSVYKQHPGYSDKSSGLFSTDLGAPEELPDALRGERWAFVQLPLGALQQVGGGVGDERWAFVQLPLGALQQVGGGG